MNAKNLQHIFKSTMRLFVIAALVVAPLPVTPDADAHGYGDGTISSTVKITSGTTNGPSLTSGDGYGRGIANIGDLDDDGVEDLLVSSITANGGGTTQGEVHIQYMNTDGSIDSTVTIDSGTSNGPTLGTDDRYGASVDGLGDLDGDGVEDIVVGAYNDDQGGSNRGGVHIHFMNTDGSIDSTVEINDATTNGPSLADEDQYGVSVANIGDLDDDGVIDLAVGAYADDTGGAETGAFYIHYMNTDGSVDSTVKIDTNTANGPSLLTGDLFGIGVEGIGDLDGDGVEDIAATAAGDDQGGGDSGAFHIMFMNTNGSIDSSVEIDSSTSNGPGISGGDNYGLSIDTVGDLDGDGVEEIAVGSYLDDTGGDDRGSLYIHYMNTNGSIDSTTKFAHGTSNGATLANFDYYGIGAAGIGDLNGDGLVDIAVGAEGDGAGSLYIHFMTPTTHSHAQTTVNTPSISRTAAGATGVQFDLSFALTATDNGPLTVTFPAGFTVTQAATSGDCSGGGTLDTFGFTAQTLTAVKTDCSGTVTMTGALITLHSTPGSYTITWSNEFGEGTIIVTDDDQVTVSASLDSTMSFNVGAELAATDCDDTFAGDGGTVALGTILDDAVTSSDVLGIYHICSRVSTNATGGAVVTAKSLNAALQSTSVPADKINSGTATLSGGTEGYGICVGSDGADTGLTTTTPVGSSPTATSPFASTCNDSGGEQVGELTQSAQSLWSVSGPTSNAFARVYVKAAISTSTPAHDDYSDTLTFIATSTF